MPTRVKLQRFYRPEDVSRAVAYEAGLYDVYAPVESDKEAEQWVDVEDIMGPCAVTAVGAPYGEFLVALLGGHGCSVCQDIWSRWSAAVEYVLRTALLLGRMYDVYTPVESDKEAGSGCQTYQEPMCLHCCGHIVW